MTAQLANGWFKIKPNIIYNNNFNYEEILSKIQSEKNKPIEENILQVDNFNKKDNKQEEYIIEQNLSLFEHEKNLISKALNKHNGKRKNAAKDLGISERTLYRKIKELNL